MYINCKIDWFIRGLNCCLVAVGFYLIQLPQAEAQTSHATGSFNITGSMNTNCAWRTATLLNNGMVLLTGGYNMIYSYLGNSSAELYNPVTGTWTATGSMSTNRCYHTATLLTNGLVLVTGGISGNNITGSGACLSSSELYNPVTGTWTTTGSMSTNRYNHTATLLTNGLVLVTGGTDLYGDAYSSSELYNPASGTWTTTGSMSTNCWSHTATLLANGQVLVAGGVNNNSILSSSKLYNPATGKWTTTGSMSINRYTHTATLLTNGQVLVAGGNDVYTYSSTELYNPVTGTWTTSGSMSTNRLLHTATLLTNGQVLIAGGVNAPNDGNWFMLSSAELYNPTTGTWTTIGSMITNRWSHTATLLINGQVLVAGGSDAINDFVSSAELFSLTPIPIISIALYSKTPVVFFPISGTNFTLQMTTNLSSPQWVTVTNGVPFSGIQVTNPPPNAFFRLY